jgi:hypothetical protein
MMLGSVGCSGGTRSHEVPWQDDDVTVIDSTRNLDELESSESNECLDLGGPDECITREEKCGADVAADVVLDEAGHVVTVVCYPEAETLTAEEIEAADGNVEQNQNNEVIVLDDVDDGVDIEGDLSVDANNVVIYGEGPDVSVVSGDVNVDGNNIIVRGVRIQGNVEVLANNAVFLLCVIEGDVRIIGNNAILTSCDIHGSVTVVGNNTQLTGNRVDGEFTDNGQNTICENNYTAQDANGDLLITDDEVGEALACAAD